MAWARCGAAGDPVRRTDRDNEYLMIDSSIVRAHAQAAALWPG